MKINRQHQRQKTLYLFSISDQWPVDEPHNTELNIYYYYSYKDKNSEYKRVNLL